MLTCTYDRILFQESCLKPPLTVSYVTRDVEGRTPCSAQGGSDGWDPGTEGRRQGVWVEDEC